MNRLGVFWRGARYRLDPVWPVLRWLLSTLVVLFGVSLLAFVLTYLTPGDLAENILTSQGITPTAEMVAAMRDRLGLTRPLWQQYLDWLGRVLHGDLGTSLSQGTDIATDFGRRLPLTMALTLVSLTGTWLIAIPLGLLVAIRQNSRLDLIVRVLSYFGSALPGFVVALMVLHLFGLQLGWLPIAASQDAIGMTMPVLTLILAMAGWYIRQVRTIAVEELDKPYIAGLRIRGMGDLRIGLHVLRNIAAPLCILAGNSFGGLLAGSAVVESIFSWQGIGFYALHAIAAKDYTIIQAYVVWCALVFLVANTVADLFAFALDPRLQQDVRRVVRYRKPPRKPLASGCDSLHIQHPNLAMLGTGRRPAARRFGRGLRVDPLLAWRVLLAVLVIVVLAGVFADSLTPYDPHLTSIGDALRPPSLAHPFGTDDLGRDVLTRVLAGIRPTLSVAFTVVACSLAIGTLIGVLAALGGRVVDALLQRLTAVFQSFPEFILVLALAAMLGPGFVSSVIALTAVYWTHVARYARILALQVSRSPYMQAARMNGVGPARSVIRHLVPNIASPVLVIGASSLGSVILNLATLSFVGLGLPRPTSEWGTMISEGRSFLQVAPWLAMGPGLALFVLILVVNLLADTSQELLAVSARSPQLAQQKGRSIEITRIDRRLARRRAAADQLR